MNLIEIEEDKDFLINQRQKGSVGCMLRIDNILAAKEKRKSDRMEQEEQRKRKCVEAAQQNSA